MRFTRVHRRFTAWLAMLAMLLGALAPTVAQAVVLSSDRSQWVEVCSASGMLWVKADADTSLAAEHGSAPVSDASMHCPWCTLHGGAAGLPPSVTMAGLHSLSSPALPAFQRVVPLAGIWAVAHARAPPQAA